MHPLPFVKQPIIYKLHNLSVLFDFYASSHYFDLHLVPVQMHEPAGSLETAKRHAF